MKSETCTGKRGELEVLIVEINLACFNYLCVSIFSSFLQNKIIFSPCCLDIRGKSLIYLKPQRSSKTKCSVEDARG